MTSGLRGGAFERGSPRFEFRAFLGARLTDGLGWTAITTVVGYQLWILTGDPLSLAWLGLVQAIPSISLALFGGHLADRRDRRSIILAASSLLTVSALLLAVIATQTSSLGGGLDLRRRYSSRASRAASSRRPWARSKPR